MTAVEKALAGGVVAAAVLVAGLVGFFTWPSSTLWDDLRATADRFEPPDGFREVQRRDVGSSFCIITCSGEGAHVQLLLATTIDDDVEACRALRPAIDELTEGPLIDPESLGLSACVVAPIDEVKENALITAAPHWADFNGQPPAVEGERYVLVRVHSGMS